MDRGSIKSSLVNILTSPQFNSLQVDGSQLNEDTSLLNDITLDSLQLLEFIVAMENEFEFAINTKKLNVDVFDRFGDVVDFVVANAPRTEEEGIHATQTA
ncbi:MAG TPA: phosphopantetheine-binding protein [Blastocatellia bacterium]|jgi:Phosphopantetheine attachment site.